MIFGQDRQELRQMYSDAWRKEQQGDIVSPLEAQIAQVVREHPEYQAVVSGDDLATADKAAGDRSNPYLHMGLHLAIRDQVATNRPLGIHTIFQKLTMQTGDRLEAEHRMLECLAETLWEAQSQNVAPDEQKYLERLRQL